MADSRFDRIQFVLKTPNDEIRAHNIAQLKTFAGE